MRRRWIIFAELSLLIALGVWAVLSLLDGQKPADAVDIKAPFPDARSSYLTRDAHGDLRYIVVHHDGSRESLEPQIYTQRLYDGQVGVARWQRILEKICNVSTTQGLLWVALALLIGQGLFTGRMVVQWLASEKHKKSVVPPMFWWMSLVGSTVLLIYFVWRKDVVGVLGQAFGWSIYIRNLLLIYGHQPPPPAGVDPAPEPELGK
jgi:lipid-A-disaccharide synthase-like uncharacterized protein